MTSGLWSGRHSWRTLMPSPNLRRRSMRASSGRATPGNGGVVAHRAEQHAVGVGAGGDGLRRKDLPVHGDGGRPDRPGAGDLEDVDVARPPLAQRQNHREIAAHFEPRALPRPKGPARGGNPPLASRIEAHAANRQPLAAIERASALGAKKHNIAADYIRGDPSMSRTFSGGPKGPSYSLPSPQSS